MTGDTCVTGPAELCRSMVDAGELIRICSFAQMFVIKGCIITMRCSFRFIVINQLLMLAINFEKIALAYLLFLVNLKSMYSNCIAHLN